MNLEESDNTRKEGGSWWLISCFCSLENYNGHPVFEEPRAKGKAIRRYTVTEKTADVKAKMKKGL